MTRLFKPDFRIRDAPHEKATNGPVMRQNDFAPLLRPMQLAQNKDTTAPPPPAGELSVVVRLRETGAAPVGSVNPVRQ